MNVVSSPIYETIYLGIEGETFTRSYSAIGATSSVLSLTATDLGDGYYRMTFTPSSVGVHVWIGESSSGIPVLFAWDVVTAQQADPAAYIAAGDITMVSPVSATGDVTLYEADSYDADESRSLDWSTTDAGTWPTLTSATIALKAVHGQTGKTISASGSVVTPTGATKQVRVELAPADTAGKPIGEYDYQVIATLTNSHVVTLEAGTLTLTERIRA